MAPLHHLLLPILLGFSGLIDAETIKFPKLPGQHAVGTKRVLLTDPYRSDPWESPAKKRSTYLHLFYPIKSFSSLEAAPYLPSAASAILEKSWQFPPSTLSSAETNLFLNGPAIFPLENDDSELPILVFSPEEETIVATHTALLSALASQGHFIIGVDHPHDSSPLATIDGKTLIPRFVNATADAKLAAKARTTDVLSIASSIDATVICGWLDEASDCHRTDDRRQLRLGIFGAGLGGSVAAMARQSHSSPYVAAAALEGQFFSRSGEEKQKRPFRGPLLYVAAEESCCAEQLKEEWESIDGWKLGLEVKGTGSGSFTDKAVIQEQVDEAVDLDNVDTTKGTKVTEVLVEYLSAYWEWSLSGKPSELLAAESKEWPEVQGLELEGNGLRKQSQHELRDEAKVEKKLEKKLDEEIAKRIKKAEELLEELEEETAHKGGKKDEL